MCGICGIIEGSGLPVNGEALRAMSALLGHRGGDGDGVFIDRSAGLAHNRLSIIDVEGGRQPMLNEDGNLCLVYNGEVYNFRELRDELAGAGHVFRTATDSEAVLHAYEEWGEGCLERLRGMFAFAVWDRAAQRLFLARDRIGIKPLYYAARPGLFAFASEAKALLPLLGQPVLNERALFRFLRFSFVPDNEETLFAGIKKLPPAHFLVLDRSGMQIKRYWSLEKKPLYGEMDFNEAKEAFSSTLGESVNEELISDVPLGVLLSGGIDSSAIAALAQKASKDLTTITARFDDGMDESGYAASVAGFLKTRHIEVKVDLRAVIDRFYEMVWHLDDLSTADGGFFTTYLLSEKVREQGIKAVLLGEGSDEILGGYRRFGLSMLPGIGRKGRLSSVAYFYSLTKELPWPSDPELEYLTKRMDECADDGLFRRISHFEINWQLPNHLLKKVDAATMARSVEARVPFLDHRLIELAYSLPDEYKLMKGKSPDGAPREKHLLREAMKGLLPEQILQRRKMGFLLPLNRFLEMGRKLVEDTVMDEGGVARNYFSRKELQRLFVKSRIGVFEKRRAALLWRLFVLSAWHRRYFIERTRTAPDTRQASEKTNEGAGHAFQTGAACIPRL